MQHPEAVLAPLCATLSGCIPVWAHSLTDMHHPAASGAHCWSLKLGVVDTSYSPARHRRARCLDGCCCRGPDGSCPPALLPTSNFTRTRHSPFTLTARLRHPPALRCPRHSPNLRSCSRPLTHHALPALLRGQPSKSPDRDLHPASDLTSSATINGHRLGKLHR